MRKGDEKRQEILTIAERFFCARGYEETSVQDIIDAASSSKGGFYHYFPSKEAVLDALCAARSEKMLEAVVFDLSQIEDPLERINRTLAGMMPFHQEARIFLLMMLPVLAKPEGLPVLVRWQEETRRCFLPILQREVDIAQQNHLIYPVTRGAAAAVLVLANQCWVDVLRMVMQAAEKAQRPDTAVLLDILETNRRSIEVLLDAPYGSLSLAKLEEWDALAFQLAEAFRRTRK